MTVTGLLMALKEFALERSSLSDQLATSYWPFFKKLQSTLPKYEFHDSKSLDFILLSAQLTFGLIDTCDRHQKIE